MVGKARHTISVFTRALCRLSMTESELTLAESKVKELNRQYVTLKEDRIQTDKLHQNELDHEKEVSIDFIRGLFLFSA